MNTLEDFLKDADDSFTFAVDAAWDQHERYPEFSRGQCLRERSFLRTLLRGDTSSFFVKACALAESSNDKRAMESLRPALRSFMTPLFSPLSLRDAAYEPGRCFRYALTQKTPFTEPGWCYIHIWNARTPESFLDDSVYVIDNFRFILARAEAEHGCTELYTATWLNSYDKFLHFFPPEWRDNMLVPLDKEIYSTGGWQGQFINRFGSLNRRTADYFLKTGRLLFKRCESHCSFKSMRNHLSFLNRGK